MCTAARDTLGWVSFLRVVLERWYGRAIYDHVLEGEMIRKWHAEHGTLGVDPTSGCYIKDMHQVRRISGAPSHATVVALDDHPETIINGEVRCVFCEYAILPLQCRLMLLLLCVPPRRQSPFIRTMWQ